METEIRFRETQRFRQPWLWGLLGLQAVVTLAGVVRGRRSGRETARRLAVLAAVALFLRSARLYTEVREDGVSASNEGRSPSDRSSGRSPREDDASGGSPQAERSGGVYVKFAPLHRTFRKIPFSDLEDLQATGYSPFRYGGWGIRWSPSGMAYTASGKSGVRLERASDGSVFVGSDRPDELLAAVQDATGREV